MVLATGAWSSPFALCLVPAGMLAGFAAGWLLQRRVGGLPRSPRSPLQARHRGRRRARACSDGLRVDRPARPGRVHQRPGPPLGARQRPPATAGARPGQPARRGQLAAVLAAARRPDAAGLARPRRGARLDRCSECRRWCATTRSSCSSSMRPHRRRRRRSARCGFDAALVVPASIDCPRRLRDGDGFAAPGAHRRSQLPRRGALRRRRAAGCTPRCAPVARSSA